MEDNIENPYLAEWLSQETERAEAKKNAEGILARGFPRRGDPARQQLQACFDLKTPFTTKYSWAIPTEEAITAVAAYSPLIEIGAGTGYWGWLLRQVSADILCFDEVPPSEGESLNGYHQYSRQWSKVRAGTEKKVKEFPDRTLLLCWPPPGSDMAVRSLNLYRGRCFIYIGEMGSTQGFFARFTDTNTGEQGRGSTGNAELDELLERNWELEQAIALPGWLDEATNVYFFKRGVRHLYT